MDLTSLSTQSLQSFIDSRKACIAAGVNVGQLDRDKMHKFSIELIRREQEAAQVI